MIDMEKMNSSISDEILKAIEQFWGFGLPKDYRDFLLRYNGGRPIKKMFRFKERDDGSCIDDLFGIVKDFNNNLLLKQKYVSDRVPENTLPIGDDVYGNLIIIAVKNPDRGKVYFWDHEREVPEGEEPNYSNLTLIADSFDEFINSLHTVEN